MTQATQSIDLEAWRRDGQRLWEQIDATKLVVIAWRNPWVRFGIIAAVLLTAAAATFALNHNVLVSGLIAAVSTPFAFTAAKYYSIGVRTGGLYAFFSDKGFGVGCDADRICIPYSAIRLPEKVTPSTVNDNYIVLPVGADSAGVMIESKTGVDVQWDGSPYKRGIVSVFAHNDELRVRAYPNEMIVHLFCAVYPLSMYFNTKNAQPSPRPDGSPAADSPSGQA